MQVQLRHHPSKAEASERDRYYGELEAMVPIGKRG